MSYPEKIKKDDPEVCNSFNHGYVKGCNQAISEMTEEIKKRTEIDVLIKVIRSEFHEISDIAEVVQNHMRHGLEGAGK